MTVFRFIELLEKYVPMDTEVDKIPFVLIDKKGKVQEEIDTLMESIKERNR